MSKVRKLTEAYIENVSIKGKIDMVDGIFIASDIPDARSLEQNTRKLEALRDKVFSTRIPEHPMQKVERIAKYLQSIPWRARDIDYRPQKTLETMASKKRDTKSSTLNFTAICNAVAEMVGVSEMGAYLCTVNEKRDYFVPVYSGQGASNGLSFPIRRTAPVELGNILSTKERLENKHILASLAEKTADRYGEKMKKIPEARYREFAQLLRELDF